MIEIIAIVVSTLIMFGINTIIVRETNHYKKWEKALIVTSSIICQFTLFIIIYIALRVFLAII